MRTLRLVFAAVMLVFMLAGQSQSAFAGPVTHLSVHLNDATILWLFPLTSVCSQIPEGTSINPYALASDRVKHATQREKHDDTVQIVISDLVKGTATDNFGAAYTFVYQNHSTYDFDGSIVSVNMQDTFQLKGGDVNYTVGFNWRWAYPADSLELVEITGENGETVDIAVDPFFFATNDGENEDPNIVPGSWEKLSTRGDPFNCDPL